MNVEVGLMTAKREITVVAVIFLCLAIILVDIIFTLIQRDFLLDMRGMGPFQRLIFAWFSQINLLYRVMVDGNYRSLIFSYLNFALFLHLLAALANVLSYFLGLLLAAMVLLRWRRERRAGQDATPRQNL